MTFRSRKSVKLILLFSGLTILCYPQNKLVIALNSVVRKIQNQDVSRHASDKFSKEKKSAQNDSISSNERSSHSVNYPTKISNTTDKLSIKTDHHSAKIEESQSINIDSRRIGTVTAEEGLQSSQIHLNQVTTSSRAASASSHLHIRTPQNPLVTTNYQYILLTGFAEIRSNTILKIYVNDQILNPNLLDLHTDDNFTVVIPLETGENRIRVVYQHDDQMIEEFRMIKRDDNFRFGQHSLTLVGLEDGLAVIDVVTQDIVGYIPSISVRKLLPFPDGIHVAIEYDGLFELFDASSGRFIAADLPGNGMKLSRSYSGGYGYFYMNDNNLMVYGIQTAQPISLGSLTGNSYSSLWVTESGNAWATSLNNNGNYNLEGHAILSEVDSQLSCDESIIEFWSDSVPVVTSSTNNNWIFYSRADRSRGVLHAMQKDGGECISWTISTALGKNPNNIVLDHNIDNLNGKVRVFTSSLGDDDPLFGGGKIRCFEYNPMKEKWRNVWVHGRNGVRQISLSNDGEWLSYTADDSKIYYIRTGSAGTARIEWSVFLGTTPVDMVHVFQTGLDDNIISLTISIEPDGAGTIEGDGDYEQGEFVPIIATPEPGYRFISWVGEGVSDSGVTNTTVAMTEDRQIVAKFEVIQSSARSIVETGRDTHIAIIGDGFFAVEYDGETGFTKTGDFFLKPDPENAGGYVLSRANGAILLGAQESDGELSGPVRFSQYPENISIRAFSGRVVAVDNNGDSLVENEFIKITDFSNNETLELIDSDIYHKNAGTTEKTIVFKSVSQGHISSPEEMTPNKYIDWDNNVLENTNRRYDLAIDGEGFFAVFFKNEIVYTRAGDFNLIEDLEIPGTYLLIRPNGAVLMGSFALKGDPAGPVRFTAWTSYISVDYDAAILKAKDEQGNSLVENEFVGIYRFSNPDGLIRIDDDDSLDPSLGIYRETTLANKILPSEASIREGSLASSLSVSKEQRIVWTNGPIENTDMLTHFAIDGNGFFRVRFEGENLYSRLGDFSLEEDFDLPGTFILRRPNGAILLGAESEFGKTTGPVRFSNFPGSLTVGTNGKVDSKNIEIFNNERIKTIITPHVEKYLLFNQSGESVEVENAYIQIHQFLNLDELEEVEIGPYHCRSFGVFRETNSAKKINSTNVAIRQGMLEKCNIDVLQHSIRDFSHFKSAYESENNDTGSIYLSVMYRGETLYMPYFFIYYYLYNLKEDAENSGKYVLAFRDDIVLLGSREKNEGLLHPIQFSEYPKSIRIDRKSGEIRAFDYFGKSIVNNKFVSIRRFSNPDQLVGLDYDLYRDLSPIKVEDQQSSIENSSIGIVNRSVHWKGSILMNKTDMYYSGGGNIAIRGEGFFVVEKDRKILYTRRGDFWVHQKYSGSYVLKNSNGVVLLGSASANDLDSIGPVMFDRHPIGAIEIDSESGLITTTDSEVSVTNPYILIYEFPNMNDLLSVEADDYRRTSIGLFYPLSEVKGFLSSNFHLEHGKVELWNFDIANEIGNSRGKLFNINGVTSSVSIQDNIYIPSIFQDQKVYSSGPDLLVVEDSNNSEQYLLCRPNGAILLGASVADGLPVAPIRFVEKPHQVNVNVSIRKVEAIDVYGNDIVENGYINIFYDSQFSPKLFSNPSDSIGNSSNLYYTALWLTNLSNPTQHFFGTSRISVKS